MLVQQPLCQVRETGSLQVLLQAFCTEVTHLSEFCRCCHSGVLLLMTRKDYHRHRNTISEGEEQSMGQCSYIDNTSCPTNQHATVDIAQNSMKSFEIFATANSQTQSSLHFCCEILLELEHDHTLMAKTVFSDDTTTHLFRHVNRNNVTVSGSNTLRVGPERTRQSLHFQCLLCLIQTAFGPFLLPKQVRLVYCKGKGHPVTLHAGTEGEQKYIYTRS